MMRNRLTVRQRAFWLSPEEPGYSEWLFDSPFINRDLNR